jgi:autotransporter-associated beta strand protein
LVVFTGRVTSDATVQVVTIHSSIVDNGAGNNVRLVKSGQGSLTLTSANTYAGGTIVNQGTLNLSATAALSAGTYVIPGDLTINPATWTNTLTRVDMNGFAGQINPAATVTLNGGTFLRLFGANTLSRLVLNSVGGEGAPRVEAISAGAGTGVLTLTSNNPISVLENTSGANVATIAGVTLSLYLLP